MSGNNTPLPDISGPGERDRRVVVLLLLGLFLFAAGQIGEEGAAPFFPCRQTHDGLGVIRAEYGPDDRPVLVLSLETSPAQQFSAPLAVPAPLPAAFTPFFFQPVPVNEADAGLLATVPGVGPSLAARILARRDTIGRFDSLEELLAVSGIGKKKLEKLREYLRI